MGTLCVASDDAQQEQQLQQAQHCDGDDRNGFLSNLSLSKLEKSLKEKERDPLVLSVNTAELM